MPRWMIFVACLTASTHAFGLESSSKYERGNYQPEGIHERVSMTPVGDNGLIAELYKPVGQRRAADAAILTLGACTPGNARGTAQGLANVGYVTLALFYCGPNTPTAQIAEVPLEYIKAAVDWLKAAPDVKAKHVAAMGISLGAQAALIAGSTFPDIEAVVAIAPSNIVTQALGPPPDPIASAPATSTWSFQGKPVPFRPHGSWETIENGIESNPASLIPVERINGPVLLVSGTDDKSWPAAVMGDRIIARLTEHRFRHGFTHLRYANAGHGLFASRDPNDPAFAELFRRSVAVVSPALGGSPEGNIAAQADSWPKVLAFLASALKG